ncbi:MAG: hypothetical protein PHW76_04845, partial [Alphaproteobacteria bacterium]|nr:hypothetical protein [Alphaproteobacteria bacterium]
LPLCSCAMCGEAFNNTTSGGSSSAPSGLTSYQLCMNGAFDQNYQFKTVTTNRSMPYYNPNWSEWWTWKCKLIRDDGSTNSHTCHLPKR